MDKPNKRPGTIVFLRQIHLNSWCWGWGVECAFIDSPNFVTDYLGKSLRLCVILSLAVGFESLMTFLFKILKP